MASERRELVTLTGDKIMDARESMKSVAKSSKLVHGDYVVVEYSGSGNWRNNPEKRIGYVNARGEMTVGGCVPSAGMVGNVLSLPFQASGGDNDRVYTLADGTQLRKSSPKGTVVWLLPDGSESKGLIEEAIERTPAVAK